MSDIETQDAFCELFWGRDDAYGSWTGGMVPSPEGTMWDRFLAHLHDGPYIGVYPQTDDNTVGWGCIDLDGKDFVDDWDTMWRIAAELQDVLAYKEVTSWLERTAHGIHVWVFAEERVPAATMRHALLVACEVANYKPKEVNPKQTSLSEAKPFGNYIRLPYYGALKNGTPPDRFVIDEDGVPMTVEAFSRSSLTCRTSVRTLEDMATLYVEPAPSAAAASIELDAATEDQFVLLRPILPAVVEMMFADGVSGDRSQGIVRACAILKDDGWQAQSIFTVLRALDRLVLRKFADRADPDGPLLRIMERCGL